MANKFTSESNSRILDNKLSVILAELNSKLKDSSISEKEELLISFNNTLSKFYKTLANPVLSTDPFRKGVVPNYTALNKKFYEIGQDLDILYKEINSLHGFVTQNYNTLNTLSSAVRAQVRKIASDVGDYKLYANDNLGGAIYFSDTYKNTDKIDYSDRLYKESKCFVDIFSGYASLPLDPAKTVKAQIDQINIGSASNGVAGNNQEIGALRRDRLDSLTDNSPDTWFEYEVVEKTPTNNSLLLELRFKFDEAIINNLELSTVNFASKKHPNITRLEISSDGVIYNSIMDEILTSTASAKNDSKIINLNPDPDSLSESRKYYFSPRKISYLKIVFEQSDTYLIRTPSGTSYRKAIGIRDINIGGQAYLSKGELASVSYVANSEVGKVALSIDAVDSLGLTKITNYISVNDGQSWQNIQDVAQVSSDSPEILNFNLDTTGSIATDSPVVALRHKVLLERDPQGFSSKGGKILVEDSKTEFLNISPSTQSIALKEKPIINSLNIFNISYGSVGGSDLFFIPRTDIIERDDLSFVYLPSSPFYKNSIETDQEIVIVKNEIWARVADISSAGATKSYEFDYLNNIIKFGDGTNGLKPDADISFGIKRERVLIDNNTPKLVETKYNTDEVLSSTKLYRLEAAQTKQGFILRKAGAVHSLGFTDINSIAVTADPGSVLQNEKPYINGAQELLIAGDYSIDKTNGILYTKTITPSVGDTTISITYNPRKYVTNISFLDGKIKLKDEDYISVRRQYSNNIVSATNVIDTGFECIEPRSFRFLTLNSFFSTEVPYKGDGSEFDLPKTPSELQGYYTVDYKNGIIYTYSAVTGNLNAEFNNTEYYAEYNIAVEIPREEYTVDLNNSLIVLSDRYVVKNFSNSLARFSSRTLFKASYKFAKEISQNPRELEPFFTPLLKEYRLAVLTKEKL